MEKRTCLWVNSIYLIEKCLEVPSVARLRVVARPVECAHQSTTVECAKASAERERQYSVQMLVNGFVIFEAKSKIVKGCGGVINVLQLISPSLELRHTGSSTGVLCERRHAGVRPACTLRGGTEVVGPVCPLRGGTEVVGPAPSFTSLYHLPCVCPDCEVRCRPVQHDGRQCCRSVYRVVCVGSIRKPRPKHDIIHSAAVSCKRQAIT